MIKFYSSKETNKFFSYPCHYPQGYTLFFENDFCDKVGVILEGSLKMHHYLEEGNERIIANLNKGEVFGDFLIHSSAPYFPGDITATSETVITYLSKPHLDQVLKESTSFRNYYLNNLTNKAIELNMKNKLLTQKTLKDKIIFFLELELIKNKNKKIYYKNLTILAHYLHVERPSLSRVLTQMKREKILDYNRNYIWLNR